MSNTPPQNMDNRITIRLPENLLVLVKTKPNINQYIIDAIIFYEKNKLILEPTTQKERMLIAGIHCYVVQCPKCGHQQKFTTKARFLRIKHVDGSWKYHRKTCENCGRSFIVYKNPHENNVIKQIC